MTILFLPNFDYNTYFVTYVPFFCICNKGQNGQGNVVPSLGATFNMAKIEGHISKPQAYIRRLRQKCFPPRNKAPFQVQRDSQIQGFEAFL